MKVPTKSTLKKYGLSEQDYLDIVERQGNVCPICKLPMDKTTNIDHWHVKDWKKFPPEIRKLFVRGVVHWFCNHYYLGKGITVERAKNLVKYLEDFEKRRPK